MALDGTLDDAAAALARMGVVIAFDEKEGLSHVRGVYVDRSAVEVLNSLAAQVSPDALVLARDGGVSFIGAPTDIDQSAEVFAVPAGEASDWENIYKVAASKESAVAFFEDRIVVKDTPAGLKRVEGLHAKLLQPRRQYSVDVMLVELSETAARELGVDWSASGTVDLSVGMDAALLDFQARVIALIIAAHADGDAEVVSRSRLHLVEGGEPAELQVGDSVPIPRRTVSDQGTVTGVGFDIVNTGVLLRVSARSVGEEMVRLQIDPELSEISRFVEGIPVLARRRLSSTTILQDGGICVLGGLSSYDTRIETKNIPKTKLKVFERYSENRRRLFVFVRASIVDPGGSRGK